MWKTYLSISIAVCVFIMTLTGQAGAVTRYVSPGQSIQAAIDASSNGDQIEVAPVTYNEAIDFKGKAVRLYSNGGPAVTTINGTGHYHVVQCVSGEGAKTILEGFTITGGNANGPQYPDDQFGGGMYNLHSSPTVKNCIFRSNNAKWCGGGMYNAGSSPTVTNCIFRSNSAERGGAGMANWWWSSPTVTNCTFTTNTATAVSEAFGGAIDNAAESNATVTNCILWGNYGGGGADDEISIRGGSSINITFSDIEGGQGQSWFGTRCIDADPKFLNAPSGDLRLRFGSPCINAGNNSAPNLPQFDLDGRPRIITGVVDMGAYEFLPLVENVNQSRPYESIQPAIDDAVDGDEIVVAPGTFYEAIDFKGKAIRLYSSGGANVTKIYGAGYYHVVQCVTGEDADTILEGFFITGGNANGPNPNDKSGGGMYNSNSSPTVTNCVFIGNVATYGGGMYNISSSPTVTNCVFSANFALNGGGMYNFGGGSYLSDCSFRSNYTFNGEDYAYPRGGLHGNHGGEGGCGAGMFNYDSSPIVTGCEFVGNCTGDGGKGQNGSNGGPYESGGWGGDGGDGGYGAGMYNYSSSPTVTDCDFTLNIAGSGGDAGNGGNANGFCLDGDCHGGKGGVGGMGGAGAAMYNLDSSPVVTNCEFTDNQTGVGSQGGNGGDANWEPPPGIPDDSLHTLGSGGDGGLGGSGAGVYNAHSFPAVTNCVFSSNVTGYGGDGGHQGELLRECDWYGCYNLSIAGLASCGGDGGYGAGIYNLASEPNVINCTFIDNLTGDGGSGGYGGRFDEFTSECGYEDCGTPGIRGLGGGICNVDSSPTISNSILWDDTPSEIHNVNSTTTVTYSDVKGGWPGTGNIGDYPVFVDKASGDLRLSSCSPCVDAGDNTAVPAGVTTDLADNPRFMDDERIPDTGFGAPPIVDMGAYELQLTSTYPVRNVTKDATYCTIQRAIDDANDGDDIEVPPGTYYGTIDFKGRAIHLYSIAGPQVTTIDGSGQYHVIQCVSDEDANTILDGFTITGGNANGADYPEEQCGGGMYIADSSPTVTNCIFRGNYADEGGGIDNHTNGGRPILTNCTFWANTAAFGGAINNQSKNLTITNCTFVGNSALGYSGEGGAIYDYNWGENFSVVNNCVFWGNTPDQIGWGARWPTVSYSCVQGGWYPWNGTGNIDADPCFVDVAAGDFRLLADSPCMDAGDNDAPALPLTDLDGRPRIIDGDCNDLATVDIGAYEFNHAYMGDLDYNCGVDFGDLAIIGRVWFTEEGDADYDPACNISVPPDKYIDWRDLAVIAENWLATP